MTGFAPTPNVREDTGSSPPSPTDGVMVDAARGSVSSPATCICDPYNDVFCDEAGKLSLVISWLGERGWKTGDYRTYHLAIDDLADHLRVDRTSVLTAISLRGKSDVRSQTRVP